MKNLICNKKCTVKRMEGVDYSLYDPVAFSSEFGGKLDHHHTSFTQISFR